MCALDHSLGSELHIKLGHCLRDGKGLHARLHCMREKNEIRHL